jgi:imidazoleglycerol-phosphate dehydratase
VDDIAPEGGHGLTGKWGKWKRGTAAEKTARKQFRGHGAANRASRRWYHARLFNSVSRTAMRQAEVTRNTTETRIRVAIDLDGSGRATLASGVGFFDHMLDQIARHGLFDLTVEAQGDLHIDGHHTVEDVGITLGQALARALGDKRGLRRYGHAYVPLDEALSRVVVDLSGRPGLVFNVPFTRATIGEFDVDLIREFFQGLVNHAGITVHIDNLAGINAHHQAETVFKAFARALRMAVEVDPRTADAIPSTKGAL